MFLEETKKYIQIKCDTCQKIRQRSKWLDKTFSQCNSCFIPKHICSNECHKNKGRCYTCKNEFTLNEFKIESVNQKHRNLCLQCSRDNSKKTRAKYMALNQKHDCEQELCSSSLKYCNFHKEYHNRSEFFLNRNMKDAHHSNCKIADRIYTKENLYGLSEIQFQIELKRYNFCCHLCKKPFNGDIVIDHCHHKNIYRGILHRKCNWLLGQADDDLEILTNAANYILETLDKSNQI